MFTRFRMLTVRFLIGLTAVSCFTYPSLNLLAWDAKQLDKLLAAACAVSSGCHALNSSFRLAKKMAFVRPVVRSGCNFDNQKELGWENGR